MTTFRLGCQLSLLLLLSALGWPALAQLRNVILPDATNLLSRALQAGCQAGS